MCLIEQACGSGRRKEFRYCSIDGHYLSEESFPVVAIFGSWKSDFRCRLATVQVSCLLAYKRLCPYRSILVRFWVLPNAYTKGSLTTLSSLFWHRLAYTWTSSRLFREVWGGDEEYWDDISNSHFAQLLAHSPNIATAACCLNAAQCTTWIFNLESLSRQHASLPAESVRF